MTRTLCAVGLMVLCGAVHAQRAALQPGEYLDSSGGYLVIKSGKADRLPFVLHTTGVNGHTCDAEGVIGRDGRAVLKPEPQITCTLEFAAKGDTVSVDLLGQCPAYCGARATLDGTFVKPEPGCDRASVRKARADFKRHYDRKAYSEARGALAPVVERCEKTVNVYDMDWIRNDLAITYLRLGDAAACRNVLQPLAKTAAQTDDEIRSDLPPGDAERTIRSARATRTNLKLCQSAAKGK